MRLRNTLLLTSAGILFSLLALSAPAQPSPIRDPAAEDATATNAQSPAPAMTPEQIALIDRYLTAVRAQPVGKIDTRTAAAGQGITLQVTQEAVLANGTELPKGARLIGRILRAQPYREGGSAALLSIGIERAILQNGSSVPIRCVLRAVISSFNAGSSGMLDASQQGSRRRSSAGPSVGGPTGGAVPLGSPTPMGGVPIGADSGGMGGAGSSGNGSVYPGTSGNPNGTGNGTGAVPATVGGGIPVGDPGIGGSANRLPLPNTTAVPATADPEQPVAIAGENIHDVPRRTGLPGVMLSGASVSGVSGTLSAFERNFTLDSATQLTLGIITR